MLDRPTEPRCPPRWYNPSHRPPLKKHNILARPSAVRKRAYHFGSLVVVRSQEIIHPDMAKGIDEPFTRQRHERGTFGVALHGIHMYGPGRPLSA